MAKLVLVEDDAVLRRELKLLMSKSRLTRPFF